jgi:uncharacterized protein (TIGR03437 family)
MGTRSLPIIAAALLFSAAGLHAQIPQIAYRGVVNSASLLPPGLPGGSIARGSLFTISGLNLGPATAVQAATFPYQTTLSGVAVRVVQGTTALNAIPLSVSRTKINAIMPSNAPLGNVSLQVVVNGASGNFSPVRVVNASVGILSVSGSGNGPGVIQNSFDDATQVPNTTQAPATPLQTAILSATGLGPATGADNVAPAKATLPTQVEVFVGGVSAQISYSGRDSCCAGQDQILFQVPPDAPLGCWVPVYVRTGGNTVSNVVTMSISADGSACSDSGNPLSAAYIGGGNVAVASLFRGRTHQEGVVHKPIDITTDGFMTSVTQESGGASVFAPFLSEPPAGACTLILQSGDYLRGDPIPGPRTTVRNLDYGGPLMLSGPRGTRALKEASKGMGGASIGSAVTGYSITDRTYFDPGDYTLTSAGGADVGPIQAQVTFGAPFVWSNPVGVVDRSKPLVLNWTGGVDGQTLAAFGGTVDYPTNSTALFYCIAPPGATSITVPPDILQAIPATRPNMLQSNSAVHLTNMPLANAVPLTADGLDAGAARAIYMTGRTVAFQ